MPKSLNAVIEASLTELQIDARDYTLDPVSRHYAEVILHFMNSNNEALAFKARQFREDPLVQAEVAGHLQDLQQITGLRLQLRNKKITPKEIQNFLELKLSEEFEAEKYFLLGRCYEALQNDQENIACSLKASALYKKVGCFRKSIRAFYNAIVAESRLIPHKSYISEYQAVIQQAEQINDLSFAGLAQTMISREFQIIGEINEALRLSEQGLSNLASEKGSFHYYHALLHQADLLIQLGRTSEAVVHINEAKLAHFPEMKAALVLLECFLDQNKIWPRHLERDLLPTWQERLSLLNKKDIQEQSSHNLTELEMKLVKILWNGPQNKWDIITKIYGDETDSEILENRFKNLIARTKKKLPETINFFDGRYFIENKTELRL